MAISEVTAGNRRLSGRVRAGDDDVLVVLDESASGAWAARWAARTAELLGTGLTICLVHAPARGVAGSRELLDRATAIAAHRLGRAHVRPILAHGEITRVLSLLSRNASLLALGGSQSAPRILAQASCPVVVHSPRTSERGALAGRVVVGLDGSSDTTTVLDFAARQASARGVPLAAVTVAAPDAAAPLFGVAAQPAEAVRMSGPVAPALVRAAAGADLLVVGAGAVRGWPVSVMAELVATAPCPLAIVPAEGP